MAKKKSPVWRATAAQLEMAAAVISSHLTAVEVASMVFHIPPAFVAGMLQHRARQILASAKRKKARR